jgi:tRNA(fMet)-specific endonuclease VapC
MKFLLDTNIFIALIKRKPVQTIARLSDLSVGDIGLSSITLAELQYGVVKSGQPERNRQALEEFLLPLEIAAFDRKAADIYGIVRAGLEKAGTPIGPLDTMIAAHALSLEATLVTNNTREFCRIPALKIDDWTI